MQEEILKIANALNEDILTHRKIIDWLDLTENQIAVYIYNQNNGCTQTLYFNKDQIEIVKSIVAANLAKLITEFVKL